MLEKRVVHLGVGTPGRIKELIKQGRERGSDPPRQSWEFALPPGKLGKPAV